MEDKIDKEEVKKLYSFGEVEKGIPMPELSEFEISPEEFPFREMDIGDSFFIKCDTDSIRAGIIYTAAAAFNMKASYRRYGGGLRVWRVSKDKRCIDPARIDKLFTPEEVQKILDVVDVRWKYRNHNMIPFTKAVNSRRSLVLWIKDELEKRHCHAKDFVDFYFDSGVFIEEEYDSHKKLKGLRTRFYKDINL